MSDNPLDDCRVITTDFERITFEGDGGLQRGREVMRGLVSQGYCILSLSCGADTGGSPGRFVLRAEREVVRDRPTGG